MMQKLIFCLIFYSLLLAACAGTPAPVENLTPVHTPTPQASSTLAPTQTQAATLTSAPTATWTHTPTPSATDTPVPTETLTPAPTQTATASPTPIPTYIVLRGKVIIDQAVCHYGPGAPYLYKFGVYKDSNLEILRRVEVRGGDYLEIQAIGGNNRCWVKADYFEIKGDLANVEPVKPDDVPLPMTPYYNSTVTGVSASRSGSEVTVSWQPFQLRAGDDSEQYPYLVEAWVCQGGRQVFYPVGTYQTSIQISDEPGCAEPSHARIYAVEKHGYTRWVEIPWP